MCVFKNKAPLNFYCPLHKTVMLLTFVSYVGLAACAHPISDELRARIDPNIKFQQIFKQTDDYLDKNVMLGGIIVKTTNFENRAEVEVIQKDLDNFGYPSREDKTDGRFIFIKEGFLDPEIWSKGRYVTGAGVAKGARTGKIDNKNYLYPLIEAAELKLWENYNYSFYYGSYYGPFYRPYYFYGDGFGRFRHFGLGYYPY
jgi:outer membrane lipoprotein